MKPISVGFLRHHCHTNPQMLLPDLPADEHDFKHNPASLPLNKHTQSMLGKKRGKNIMIYPMI